MAGTEMAKCHNTEINAYSFTGLVSTLCFSNISLIRRLSSVMLTEWKKKSVQIRNAIALRQNRWHPQTPIRVQHRHKHDQRKWAKMPDECFSLTQTNRMLIMEASPFILEREMSAMRGDNAVGRALFDASSNRYKPFLRSTTYSLMHAVKNEFNKPCATYTSFSPLSSRIAQSRSPLKFTVCKMIAICSATFFFLLTLKMIICLLCAREQWEQLSPS